MGKMLGEHDLPFAGTAGVSPAKCFRLPHSFD
jgi:hypothetical protein